MRTEQFDAHPLLEKSSPTNFPVTNGNGNMIFIMKLHGKNVNKPRSPRSQTYTELLTLFSTPQTSRFNI
jgi:hypothetical protein